MPCGMRPPRCRRNAAKTPGSNRPGLRCQGPWPGPVEAAALARACQRVGRAVRGVGPPRCVVRSGHAATRPVAAGCRRGRSGMRAGVGDGICAGCVAGRGCKAGHAVLPLNFRVPAKGRVLVTCLWSRCPATAGSLGDHGPPWAQSALHHLRMRHLRLMRTHLRTWGAPVKLRQIKHLRNKRGPAHYRGQRPAIGASRRCNPDACRQARREDCHAGTGAAPAGR
jgi:hypothetical protein